MKLFTKPPYVKEPAAASPQATSTAPVAIDQQTKEKQLALLKIIKRYLNHCKKIANEKPYEGVNFFSKPNNSKLKKALASTAQPGLTRLDLAEECLANYYNEEFFSKNELVPPEVALQLFLIRRLALKAIAYEKGHPNSPGIDDTLGIYLGARLTEEQIKNLMKKLGEIYKNLTPRLKAQLEIPHKRTHSVLDPYVKEMVELFANNTNVSVAKEEVATTESSTAIPSH